MFGVLLALSLSLAALADAYTGSGAIWGMKRGAFYLTNRAGTAAGLSAAYTANGSDGYLQIGPGLESLDLTGLPTGQNIMRTTYQGIDFLGRPFRIYDGLLTKRFQVDSTGAAVTGALSASGAASFSGKVVINDSLRVGLATTLNNGLTVQGAGITFAKPLSFSTTSGDGISFTAATSGASIYNAAAGKLQLGGRNNATTLVLNGSGTRDVVVNGDLEATDSLTTGGSLIVDGSANINGDSWVAGKWTVGDSLRVNLVANFDAGVQVLGNSWVDGAVDVSGQVTMGDSLITDSGIRTLGGIDVTKGNVLIHSGQSYQMESSTLAAKTFAAAGGTDDVTLYPLSATGSVNVAGTSLVRALHVNANNGDAWVRSSLTVGDSLAVTGASVLTKVTADSISTTGNINPSGYITIPTGKGIVGTGTGSLYLSNTGVVSMKTTGGVDATIISSAGGTDILRILPLVTGGSIDFLNYGGSSSNLTVRNDGIVVSRSYAFASLPAAVSGGQVYCSDCLGPADGGSYTPGAAAGGGSGNMLFGIAGAWYGF